MAIYFHHTNSLQRRPPRIASHPNGVAFHSHKKVVLYPHRYTTNHHRKIILSHREPTTNRQFTPKKNTCLKQLSVIQTTCRIRLTPRMIRQTPNSNSEPRQLNQQELDLNEQSNKGKTPNSKYPKTWGDSILSTPRLNRTTNKPAIQMTGKNSRILDRIDKTQPKSPPKTTTTNKKIQTARFNATRLSLQT